MEKRTQQNPIRIVVTGPESTGKTTLAMALAEHFNGGFLPEHAREYVEKLDHHYTFEDVCNIANGQLDQYKSTITGEFSIYFFDTWLIITKVWFEWVFGRVPENIEQDLNQLPIDLYLLCSPDLPWEPDSVRENGGENRLRLFDCYKKELTDRGFEYVVISGEGEKRLQNAIVAIENFIRRG